MMNKYVVAHGNVFQECLDRANKYMELGYIPTGGITYTMGNGDWCYMQALYISPNSNPNITWGEGLL